MQDALDAACLRDAEIQSRQYKTDARNARSRAAILKLNHPEGIFPHMIMAGWP
jgi:hypothetical protein